LKIISNAPDNDPNYEGYNRVILRGNSTINCTDSDGDGVTDTIEEINGLNPNDVDTDMMA
jgi:hypothetical protein